MQIQRNWSNPLDSFVFIETLELAQRLGIHTETAPPDETRQIHASVARRYMGTKSSNWSALGLWDRKENDRNGVLITNRPELILGNIRGMDLPLLFWAPDREKRALRFASQSDLARCIADSVHNEYGIAWGQPSGVESLLWYHHHGGLMPFGNAIVELEATVALLKDVLYADGARYYPPYDIS